MESMYIVGKEGVLRCSTRDVSRPLGDLFVVMREMSGRTNADSGIGLEYGTAGFAVRVRELLAAGERVTFDVTGRALQLLRPYVEEHDMSKLMGAAVVPELQELVVAVVLAQSHSLGVSLSVSADAAHVELGLPLN